MLRIGFSYADQLIAAVEIATGLVASSPPPEVFDELPGGRRQVNPPPPGPHPRALQFALLRSTADQVPDAPALAFAQAVDTFVATWPSLARLRRRFEREFEYVPSIGHMAVWAEEYELDEAPVKAAQALVSAASVLLAAMQRPLLAKSDQHEAAARQLRVEAEKIQAQAREHQNHANQARGVSQILNVGAYGSIELLLGTMADAVPSLVPAKVD